MCAKKLCMPTKVRMRDFCCGEVIGEHCCRQRARAYKHVRYSLFPCLFINIYYLSYTAQSQVLTRLFQKQCRIFQIAYARTSEYMDRTLKLSNTQQGGLKNPHSFTDTQHFIDFFYEIIFLSMTQFNIFQVFVENSVKSQLCFF